MITLLAVTLIGPAKIDGATHLPGEIVTVAPAIAVQLAEAEAIAPLTAAQLSGFVSPAGEGHASERDDLLARLSSAEARATLAEAEAADAKARIAELETAGAAAPPADVTAPVQRAGTRKA